MELLLTHASPTTIAVECDGAPSHTFELSTIYPFPITAEGEPALLADPVAYGQLVYAALFGADTAASRALRALPEQLLLVAPEPDVQAVPWEYAYGPDDWVVTEVAFVRGLPAAQRRPPAAAAGPLHVIVVPSQPLNDSIAPLDTAGEWLRLSEVLSEVDHAVTVERTVPATLAQLRELLAGQRGRVIHFTGHGGQTPAGAVLLFEREIGDRSADEINARGNLEEVSARDFIKHIRGTAQLVVLSACVSATPGETPFNNLAAALVERAIPYALGMRFSVIDIDANAFCRALYGELARGVPVEEAVRQARMALTDSARPWAIGVPVLYTSLASPALPFERLPGTPQVLEHRPHLDLEALPEVPGQLLGRTGPLLRLEWYLTGDRRVPIVTVHGPSGQGKSALVRTAAARIAHDWPGGVLALNLEHLPAKAQLLHDIGQFQGLDAASLADPARAEAAVEAHFDAHRTLLILDSAETLAAGVQADDPTALELAQWLQQLPSRHVSLLLTSRLFFGWEGELGVELDGLEPDAGALVFRQSAPQRLDELDQATAEALSARVAGHPLSLRLLGSAFNETAATLAEFSADVWAQLRRAENRYVQASHRHLTLQTCIDTSMRVLPDELRQTLSSLWIFENPFSATAAAALVGNGAAEPATVAAQLHRLWQHSLLERLQLPGDLVLYRAQPVLRQYFETSLAQVVDQPTLLSRFAAAQAAQIELIYGSIKSDEAATSLARECRDDLDRALPLLKGKRRATAAVHWGWINFHLENAEHAVELLEPALAWTAKHDEELHFQALNNLALAKSALGADDEAAPLYKQALALARKAENTANEIVVLGSLGSSQEALSDYAGALKSYAKALKLQRKTDDQAAIAETLHKLGRCQMVEGPLDEAITSYRGAIEIFHTLGDGSNEGTSTTALAYVYRLQADWPLAATTYQAAVTLLTAAEDQSGLAVALVGLAETQMMQGDAAASIASYQQAQQLRESLEDQAGLAEVHIGLATAYRALQQPAEALTAYQTAYALCQAVGDRATQVTVIKQLAATLYTDLHNAPNPALMTPVELLSLAIAVLNEAALRADSDGTTPAELQAMCWRIAHDQPLADPE